MPKRLYPLTALFCGLLGACEQEAPAGLLPFIAPLDGQTHYPIDLPLRVVSAGIDIPNDYPIPDLIRVSRLDVVCDDDPTCGLVSGNIVLDSHGITFTPNDGWRPNRRYAWKVAAPTPVPHGPELSLPEHLVGTAVFDTTPRLKLLNGGVDEDGRTCMVFSRPIDQARDSGTLRVTINDIEIDDALFSMLGPDELGPGYDLDPDDPGVSVVCLTTEQPITGGASLRLTWGKNGPWRIDLLDATPDELVELLRRGNR
jgi:hypothetical protein